MQSKFFNLVCGVSAHMFMYVLCERAKKNDNSG